MFNVSVLPYYSFYQSDAVVKSYIYRARQKEGTDLILIKHI